MGAPWRDPFGIRPNATSTRRELTRCTRCDVFTADPEHVCSPLALAAQAGTQRSEDERLWREHFGILTEFSEP